MGDGTNGEDFIDPESDRAGGQGVGLEDCGRILAPLQGIHQGPHPPKVSPYFTPFFVSRIGSLYSLDHEIANLRIKRVFGFCAIIHTIAIPSASDQIQASQFSQFLPERAIIEARTAFDFTDMEFFSNSTEKEPEDLRPGSR